MNAYRVALILCRAVAIALWGMAGARLLSLAIGGLLALTNIGGFRGPISSFSLQPAMSFVALVIVAGFLQIFASSMATSMTGGAAFEGDSIASSRTLDATEKALGNAGAGLFLLFFSAANAIPGILSGVFGVVFGGFGSGITASFTIYNLLANLIPEILQCLVGFILAFSLGLRRLVKSQ